MTSTSTTSGPEACSCICRVTHPGEASRCSSVASVFFTLPGGRHSIHACAECAEAISRRVDSDAQAILGATMPDPFVVSTVDPEGPDLGVIEVPVFEVLSRLEAIVSGPLVEYIGVAIGPDPLRPAEAGALASSLLDLSAAIERARYRWESFTTAEARILRGEAFGQLSADIAAPTEDKVVELVDELELAVRKARVARRRHEPTPTEADAMRRHLLAQQGTDPRSTR